MEKKALLFNFYTVTPLHAGGSEAEGAIDLPIQREAHTGYPTVFSSSIKGSLREYFLYNLRLPRQTVDAIFGSENETEGSGQVIFTDAKLLLFPVRSSSGVFKWVLCPHVLVRINQDLDRLGLTNDLPAYLPEVSGLNAVAFDSTLEKIVIEDFPLALKVQEELPDGVKTLTVGMPNEGDLRKRLIVVSDEVYSHLTRNCTQVIARNKLKADTKTSENLWFEEVVTPDTLFYLTLLPVSANSTAISEVAQHLTDQLLQLGSGKTVGYGMVNFGKELMSILK